MKKIEIYTGPNCSYCEQAKALLHQRGLKYTERNISEPEAMEELRKRLPRSKSLPQIFIDGCHTGRLEDLQILLRHKDQF